MVVSVRIPTLSDVHLQNMSQTILHVVLCSVCGMHKCKSLYVFRFETASSKKINKNIFSVKIGMNEAEMELQQWSNPHLFADATTYPWQFFSFTTLNESLQLSWIYKVSYLEFKCKISGKICPFVIHSLSQLRVLIEVDKSKMMSNIVRLVCQAIL